MRHKYLWITLFNVVSLVPLTLVAEERVARLSSTCERISNDACRDVVENKQPFNATPAPLDSSLSAALNASQSTFVVYTKADVDSRLAESAASDKRLDDSIKTQIAQVLGNMKQLADHIDALEKRLKVLEQPK